MLTFNYFVKKSWLFLEFSFDPYSLSLVLSTCIYWILTFPSPEEFCSARSPPLTPTSSAELFSCYLQKCMSYFLENLHPISLLHFTVSLKELILFIYLLSNTSSLLHMMHAAFSSTLHFPILTFQSVPSRGMTFLLFGEFYVFEAFSDFIHYWSVPPFSAFLWQIIAWTMLFSTWLHHL